ncbi:MAG TPA: hypothetical protein ENJ29_09905 [Bacteroidetes bacterium]|nr:hypothetical protein [Bacteroidota bacterium]
MSTVTKNVMTVFALTAALLVSTSQQASAQGKEMPKRKFGLSASLAGGQGTLNVPIWITRSLVIAPAIGLVNVGNGGGTTITGGAALKLYRKTGRVAPYLGGSGMISIVSAGGTSSNSIGATGFFGSEYFLHYYFSLNIEGGVSVVIPPSPAAMTISTYTALGANIYW